MGGDWTSWLIIPPDNLIIVFRLVQFDSGHSKWGPGARSPLSGNMLGMQKLRPQATPGELDSAFLPAPAGL